MQPIQFFSAGVEYTTRFELTQKYPALSYNKLQRLLEQSDLAKIEYKNQFYFEKSLVELRIESLLNNKL